MGDLIEPNKIPLFCFLNGLNVCIECLVFGYLHLLIAVTKSLSNLLPSPHSQDWHSLAGCDIYKYFTTDEWFAVGGH